MSALRLDFCAPVIWASVMPGALAGLAAALTGDGVVDFVGVSLGASFRPVTILRERPGMRRGRKSALATFVGAGFGTGLGLATDFATATYSSV